MNSVRAIIFLKNHKFFVAAFILSVIFLILMVPTQGLLFIVLSIVFWICGVSVVGSGFFILMSTLSLKKPGYKIKGVPLSEFDKKMISLAIVMLCILLGFFGFIIYMKVVPNVKGFLNEGYLHDTVNKIVYGEDSDKEKIDALLVWFDQNSHNMYNSWMLHNEGHLVFQFPQSYVFFLDVSPFICIRCFSDNDARWILTSRCGACAEYSRLFMIMADSLGVDVRRVCAPGEDHWWNEVKINTTWIPVDSTAVNLPLDTGWKSYSFMEEKEGNVSYAWAEYPASGVIEDRTSSYTRLTTVTLYCVDEENNALSNVTVTIISHNLRRAPYQKTFVSGRANPTSNESGYCMFQIGGGNYTFQAVDMANQQAGELKLVTFSDDQPSHDFRVVLKKKAMV